MIFGSPLSESTLAVVIVVGVLAIAAIIAAVIYNRKKETRILYYAARKDIRP